MVSYLATIVIRGPTLRVRGKQGLKSPHIIYDVHISSIGPTGSSSVDLDQAAYDIPPFV